MATESHAVAQQLIACFRYEMGRQAANTKLSTNVAVRRVRVRGGNFKFRALRLDAGNFSWGSEAVTRKTRLLDVVYNASNNELVSRLWHSEEILMSGSQRRCLVMHNVLPTLGWPGYSCNAGCQQARSLCSGWASAARGAKLCCRWRLLQKRIAAKAGPCRL